MKKQGQRIFKDVDLYNVVAVLPGKKMPETQVVVSGHYDSLNLGTRPAGAAAGPGSGRGRRAAVRGRRHTATMTLADFEKNAELPAPGVCDDGSGTAAVMELARVMSQYEFDKTLVFVAFAGEEQGLIGSSLQAAKAKKENQVIEARAEQRHHRHRCRGQRPHGQRSRSTSIATRRWIRSPATVAIRAEIGERYLPSMKVNTVFMGDRLGRGGDHTPFQWEGFAAVRISTPNEIYANQHRATDMLANMSVPYTVKVAKVNLAAAASLALAPKPPIVMPEPRTGGGRQGGGAPDGTAQRARVGADAVPRR